MADGPRRPRIPPELAQRIDDVKGDVPFERWVRRACERALEKALGDSSTAEPLRTREGNSMVGGSTSPRPAPPRAPAKLKAEPYHGKLQIPVTTISEVRHAPTCKCAICKPS